MSGRNSEGNYSFSRDVLLFICTYKLFPRSSQFEGENKHDDSIVVVTVVVCFVVVVVCLFVCCPQPLPPAQKPKTLHFSEKLRKFKSLSTKVPYILDPSLQ